MGSRVSKNIETFVDANGLPLDQGYIYVGTQNLNPETNPITVYADDALTIPIAQPIRTLGGFPVYLGSPTKLVVPNLYSITIKDKNGQLVYSDWTSPGTNALGILASLLTVDGSGSGLVSEGLQSAQITDLNFDPTILGLGVRESRILTTSNAPANQPSGMTGATYYVLMLTQVVSGEYRVVLFPGGAANPVLTRTYVSSAWGSWTNPTAPPVGTVYRQGPGDSSPASLWPQTTWADVSPEEQGVSLRVGTSAANVSFFSGTPATFTVSVSAGVPTVTVVTGGSGYPASTSIPITLIGTCTTQYTASVTTTAGGALPTGAITPSAAGVAYLASGTAVGATGANFVASGTRAVIVYDGYSRIADSFMGHFHSGAPFPQTGMTQNGSSSPYSWGGGTTNTTGAVTDGANGTPRTSSETTGPYAPAKKFRRTA